MKLINENISFYLLHDLAHVLEVSRKKEIEYC